MTTHVPPVAKLFRIGDACSNGFPSRARRADREGRNSAKVVNDGNQDHKGIEIDEPGKDRHDVTRPGKRVLNSTRQPNEDLASLFIATSAARTSSGVLTGVA